ncbi:DUF4262 domain-containing protein [Streptomyces sp. NPDC056638]|uniref:DUF4262 domain-containing protein n=1 Tax=Streptomyces sp. NPDC056638 TaxID=3345887 RepID=UPI0036B2B912
MGLDLEIIESVRRHGWHVVMVPEDEIGPGLAYTIGLSHAHGVPEPVMYRFNVHAMHRMLNTLGDMAASGIVLGTGPRRHGTKP